MRLPGLPRSAQTLGFVAILTGTKKWHSTELHKTPNEELACQTASICMKPASPTRRPKAAKIEHNPISVGKLPVGERIENFNRYDGMPAVTHSIKQPNHRSRILRRAKNFFENKIDWWLNSEFCDSFYRQSNRRANRWALRCGWCTELTAVCYK